MYVCMYVYNGYIMAHANPYWLIGFEHTFVMVTNIQLLTRSYKYTCFVVLISAVNVNSFVVSINL